MTKALLSNINSIWGTIVNPQSSNTYRHILSFDTPELKKQFIDKELFEGKDFFALLDMQPEIAFTQISSTLATFRVNPMDYKNETFNTLLNKDFAIIKEGNDLRYYTLTSERKGTQIEYMADLDIFFTHDIQTIFNNKETQIQRAMIDRIQKNGDIFEFITNIKSKKMVSQFYNSEPIDSASDENLQPKNFSVIDENIDIYFDNSITDLSDDEQEMIRQNILNQKADVIYRSLAPSNDGSSGQILYTTFYNDCLSGTDVLYTGAQNGNSNNANFLPYGIFIAPQSLQIISDQKEDVNWYFAKTKSDFDNQTNLDGVNPFSKPLIEEPDVIQNSYSSISTSIFNVMNKVNQSKIKIHYDQIKSEIQIIVLAETNSYNINERIFPVEYEPKNNGIRLLHFGLRILNDDILEKPISKINKEKPFIEFKDHKDKFDINEKNNSNIYEIKSQLAPYRKFKLRHSTKLEKILLPQLFWENYIVVKQQFSFIPELWNHIVQIPNYNTISMTNSGNDLTSELQENFEDIAPYGYPTEINAYQEYMVSHRSQMTAGIFNSVTQGALNFAGASISGNTIGMVGSIGGVVSNIANMYAMQKDLSRTPLKINQTSSTLTRDMSYKKFRTNITEYELPEYMMVQIRKFFNQYGYNFNQALDDINKYLKSRYYFNYIQAPETFENIKLQASGEIKQIINDTMANGIHIWHIRDLSTFKGVKDYQYENVEMIYINDQNRGKNDKGNP